MRTFKAPYVPDNPAELPGFLRLLVAQIEEASSRADPFMELQALHAEPVRLREGMEVEADGTDWDPGSGAGRYIYRGGVWVFIG